MIGFLNKSLGGFLQEDLLWGTLNIHIGIASVGAPIRMGSQGNCFRILKVVLENLRVASDGIIGNSW